MIMWLTILIVTILLCIGALTYLISRFMRFSYAKRLSRDKRGLLILIGTVSVALLLVACGLLFGITNMMIIVILMALIWLLCDLLDMIIRKIRRKNHEPPAPAKERAGLYVAGIVAIAFTVVYFVCGYVQANTVWEKDYSFSVDPSYEPLKIAMFADSHMGTTFHADGFAGELKKIEAAEPDVLLICGDMIDGATSYEDMMGCCKALGDFHAADGVFFAYGNHDKGYSMEGRGYGQAELEKALKDNGVHVLEDEVWVLNEDYTLIGRADADYDWEGKEARADIASLVSQVPDGSYTIVLDHQPNDYEAEAAAGVNLVLSGHTHGGQLFPVNRIGELIGANDRTYGYERRQNTDFIVTSGISAWEIPLKTGCRSEYVIIDLIAGNTQ